MADDMTGAQREAADIVTDNMYIKGNPYDAAVLGRELTPDQEGGNRAFEGILQQPIFAKDQKTGIEKFDPKLAEQLLQDLKEQDFSEVQGGNSLLTEMRRKNLEENPFVGRNMNALAQKHGRAQNSPKYQGMVEGKYESSDPQGREYIKAMNWLDNKINQATQAEAK